MAEDVTPEGPDKVPSEQRAVTPGEPSTDEGVAGVMISEEEAREIQAETELLVQGDTPRAGPITTVVSALFCLALGIVGVVGGISLGMGSLTDPGPGLWPVAIGVAIVGLSVVLLVTARTYSDAEAFTRRSLQPLLAVVVLIGYVILMPLIGFEIPAFLLVAFWIKVLGRESWLMTVVGAVLIVAAFYLVFVTALGAPLPRLI